MKRLISLLVTLAMLAGMCVSVGAALPATTEYAPVESPGADLKAPFSHYVANAFENEFVNGNGLPGKERELVYKVTTSKGRSDAQLKLIPAELGAHTTYADGEKVHMTTEIMIPSGTAFYNASSAPSIGVTVLTGEQGGELTANGIGVKNKGAKTRGNAASTSKKLISFNTVNKHFELFGQGIYTDTSWQYDQWYRFDIVLTMGSNPRVSIYVDGAPMKINTDYGNGVAFHYDCADATFDGSRTTSEDVKIGCYDAEWNYSDVAGVWGVKEFYPLLTNMGPNEGVVQYNTLYADNISYKALAKGVEANIPESLGIAGYADGATVEPSLLTDVTVNPPAWTAHKVAKIALSVDGATAQEDTTAPYTFDLSNLERGIRYITLTAYDSNNAVLKDTVQSLVVAGNEKRIWLDETFDNMSNATVLTGKFYGYSTRSVNLDGTMGAITVEAVTDSAEVTHEKAVKIFAKDFEVGSTKTVEFKWGPNPNSSEEIAAWPNLKSGTAGLVKVSYDMYLPDLTNVTDIDFSVNNNGSIYLRWNPETKKFYTFNMSGWAGLGTEVSFDAIVGKWHKWEWELDYFAARASLWVDGNLVIEKATIPAPGYGVSVCGFSFNATGDGSYVAIDNMKISSETAPATIEKVMKNVNSGTLYSTMDWATQIFPNEGFKAKSSDTATMPAGITVGGIKGAVVYGEDGVTPLNADFGESLVMEFSDQDTVGSSTKFEIPVAVGVNQYNDTYPHFSNSVIEFDMYRSNTDHGDFTMHFGSLITIQVKAGTSDIKVNNSAYYDSGVDMAVGQWQHHRMEFDYNGNFAGPMKYYVDGKLVWYGCCGWAFSPESSRQGRIKFGLAGATNAETGKFKACKWAIDNLKVNYTPIVPYIQNIDFGTGNGSGNLVKAGTITPVINLVGHHVIIDDVTTGITVIDQDGNPATMGTPVVTSAFASMDSTVALTDLVLEANKTYTIKLEKGMRYDSGRNMKTHEPITYTFNTVAELPTAGSAPDDGATGDITVTGTRFTTYGKHIVNIGDGNSVMSVYAGGEIPDGNRLRADVMVNNAATTAKTFRTVIATYSNNKLLAISLGEACVVNPSENGIVVSSGEVEVSKVDGETFTAKAFLVNDMATFTPISYSYDIFGNIASAQ